MSPQSGREDDRMGTSLPQEMGALRLRRSAIDAPGGQPLLLDASAEIGRGVTLLKGANGSGKSTLLRTVVGLHPLRAGTIDFDGVDSRTDRVAFLRNVAYMPQNFASYPGLSALSLLVYFLRLRGFRRKQAARQASYWLRQVGLFDRAGSDTAHLSPGARQRLGVAYVFQTGAPLCILDEPLAGVDSAGRTAMRRILQEEGAARTILLTSHESDDLFNDVNALQIDAGCLKAARAPNGSR